MSTFYITEQTELKAKLKTLSQVSISPDGWTHYYIDKTNNDQWALTSHNSAHLYLKKQPAPSIDEVISIALLSRNRNDIAGAIFDLLDREQNNEDFRLKLIQELKRYITGKPAGFDKARVKLLIHQCELLDPKNRRDIIGKHFSEIEKDAAYYRDIAKEAKAILAGIDLNAEI